MILFGCTVGVKRVVCGASEGRRCQREMLPDALQR